MIPFIRNRSTSLSMMVLVQALTLLLQSDISYSTTFGRLSQFVRLPGFEHGMLADLWLGLRLAALAVVVVLWGIRRKRLLFKAIIALNGLLTFGLFMNLVALSDVLFGLSPRAVTTLLMDVVLMATSAVLIFSIWYWIIDPPGVEETQRQDAAWDFLFPQRGNALPGYECWQPRYSDYLYLAFTTSFAFSPTDRLPLTRRAKMLIMLQSSISLVMLTAIAGSAVNILAGSA